MALLESAYVSVRRFAEPAQRAAQKRYETASVEPCIIIHLADERHVWKMAHRVRVPEE